MSAFVGSSGCSPLTKLSSVESHHTNESVVFTHAGVFNSNKDRVTVLFKSSRQDDTGPDQTLSFQVKATLLNEGIHLRPNSLLVKHLHTDYTVFHFFILIHRMWSNHKPNEPCHLGRANPPYIHQNSVSQLSQKIHPTALMFGISRQPTLGITSH